MRRFHAQFQHALSEIPRRVRQTRDLAERVVAERLRTAPPRQEFGLPKATVVPNANYAPWSTDAEFLDAFDRIRDLTVVDVYRCYELWTLIRQLGPIDGDVLEVGVWRGGTGILLGRAAERFLSSCTVHLCDTFSGVVNAGPQDPYYRGGEFSNTSLEAVQRAVAANGLGDRVRIHHGMFPEQTGTALQAQDQFRLAHIDVDVYESARRTFEWVWPRLASGGAIVFDDYGFVDCAGVAVLVDREIASHVDGLVLHNLNGHAIVIKR